MLLVSIARKVKTMIETKEVLNKIQQAEKEAKRLVEAARRKEADLLGKVKKEADETYQKMISDGKQEAEKIIQRAAEEGEQQARQIIEDGLTRHGAKHNA